MLDVSSFIIVFLNIQQQSKAYQSALICTSKSYFLSLYSEPQVTAFKSYEMVFCSILAFNLKSFCALRLFLRF